MDGQSLDLTAERLNQLRALFPDVFTEHKIDFDRLRLALGDAVATPTEERYALTWAGKTDAQREVQRQTTATLLPDTEQSRDFDTTQHLYIEGENLEVLRVLQRAYFGKVQMIYIDPPYNTGEDSFVYPDDYSERREDYEKRTGVKDENGFLNKIDLFRKNSKENGQYHSAWLTMMYPRLFLARNLLTEDGSIFVSIDDNEVTNLRAMMDEVFGEENFIANLVWEKGRKNDAKLFSVGHEYILVYAKSKNASTVWREEKPGAREIIAEYNRLKKLHGDNYAEIQSGIREFYRSLPAKHPSLAHKRFNRVDKNGVWRDHDISWPGRAGSGPTYDVIHPDTKLPCRVPETGWRFPTIERFNLYYDNGFIEYREDHSDPPILKRYLNYVSTDFDPDARRGSVEESEEEDEEEVNVQVMPSVFYRSAQPAVKSLRALMGMDVFNNPKDPELLKRWISYVTDENALVLDFFSGSGTTAHAVFQLNAEQVGSKRRFLCVQLPEPLKDDTVAYKAGYRTIADIGRARIGKVADKLKAELAAKLDFKQDVDLGFRAFRLAPSNFKVWRGDATGEALYEQLFAFQDSHLSEAERQNMLFELLLKKGFPLSTRIESVDVDGTPLFLVGRAMLALFDPLTEAVREEILTRSPSEVLCLDACFANNDQALSNFQLELRDRKIELTIL